jgi:hypothetical protein
MMLNIIRLRPIAPSSDSPKRPPPNSNPVKTVIPSSLERTAEDRTRLTASSMEILLHAMPLIQKNDEEDSTCTTTQATDGKP